MKTIVVAASKGGVGKTTLTAALAVAALEDGEKVALIDADPQQSLAMWHLAREPSDNLVLIGDRDEAVAARYAAAEQAGYTWCLIDTPPAMINIIEPCIRIAKGGLVVIPVRPSPLDLMAIDPIVELCAQHERTSLFVLNQTTARSVHTGQAAKLLSKDGQVWDGEIGSRQIYSVAMVRGLTAPEIDKSGGPTRDEIAALWKAIKRRIGRGK